MIFVRLKLFANVNKENEKLKKNGIYFIEIANDNLG